MGVNRARLNCIDASGYTPFEYAKSYGFDLNNVRIVPDFVDCSSQESVNELPTFGELLEIYTNAILPFLSAQSLRGTALTTARENFIEYLTSFRQDISFLELFSEGYSTGLSYEQLALLSKEILISNLEEDEIAEFQDNYMEKTVAEQRALLCSHFLTLDSHYTLAILALAEYAESTSSEEKERILDKFWCYVCRLTPIEASSLHRPIQSVRSFSCSDGFQAAKCVSKAVLPFALFFGPIGNAVFNIVSVALDAPVILKSTKQCASFFATVLNINQSED